MQTNDFSNLPNSWQIKTLGEVCEIISKGATPKNQLNSLNENGAIFLKVENITQNGCIAFNNVKFIDFETHTKILKRSMLKNLDILISIAGSLARCAVLEIDNNQQININQAISFARLKDTKQVNPYFIKFYIMSPAMQIYLLSKAKTTAVPNLTLEIIRDIQIPLPPLEIQKRIVARLERAFEKIEKGSAHLQDAKTKLAKYKQSLLKSAFDGTLTAAASLRGVEKAETIHKVDCHDLTSSKLAMTDKENPKLPQGWTIKTLGEVLSNDKYAIKRGPFGSSLKKNFFVKSGVRVFEQYNPINQDVEWKRYFITQEKFKELEAFKAGAGDLLISCSGTLGKILELPQNVEVGIINQALLKIRLDNTQILNSYFVHLFNSPYMQKIILENTLGSTIQNMASVKELKQIKIPLPPLETQKQIVKLLEKHLQHADKTGEFIESALNKAKQLKQSLLKSAFLGKLT